MLFIPLLILASASSSNGEAAGRIKRQLSSICENNDLEEMHGYIAQLARSSPAFPWKKLLPAPKIFRSRTPPDPQQPSLLYNWQWIKSLSVRGLNETVSHAVQGAFGV
ncbi:hypothetical protein AAVH_30767 [Aphelenchoides avenae]|nr:hypothetical protein AAVH_30767 [Aphelenchus avenae]